MGRKDKIIPINGDEIRQLPLGARMRYARLQSHISLTEMARRLGYTKSHLSTLENNVGRPSQTLIEGYERELNLPPGTLSNVQNTELFSTNQQFAITASVEQEQEDGQETRTIYDLDKRQGRPRRNTTKRLQVATDQSMQDGKKDWGEAPQVKHFYGREKELAYLEKAIVTDGCRLIGVFGIGGVGKTTLTAKIARQLADQFEYVFWRSLQHTPPLTHILEKCIFLLSDQKLMNIPQDENEQILLLIEYLRRKRCLLILDNMESILQTGGSVGTYTRGYEGYGKFLSLIGEAEHQGCLLIASREKLKEIVYTEGRMDPVRSVQLTGLDKTQSQEVLKEEDLYGSDDAWKKLTQTYSGNPLALKLVSGPIRELFAGDIEAFLNEEEVVVGDVHTLLEQQFNRLSEREQEIMYWLAIEREPVSLEVLLQEVVRPVSKAMLIEVLYSLRRRFMIEMFKGEKAETTQFTMQPAIMEYVTNTFVKKVHQEICDETIGLFGSHVLLKAQAKDYVRETQKHLIVEPLLNRLNTSLGRENTEVKLKHLLILLRQQRLHMSEYAAGNILELLIQLKADLRHTDFSDLVVKQVDLQGISLRDVNFARADLSQSVFTETFGRILSVAVSVSGKYLAAGTANGEIRLWNAQSSTPLKTFLGHTDWVRSVAFSPDEQRIVSGSDDQSVRLWEVGSGKCLKEMVGHTGRVYTVAFHPDGNMVASGSEDQSIRLWDVNGDRQPKLLQGHTSRIYAVAFNVDKKTLATCSDDGSVRLWDIHTGRSRVLKGHTGRVWSVAFSPDGKLLASGGTDQSVHVWDIRTGRTVTERSEHNCAIDSVMFSPDGAVLAGGGTDYNIHLWNTSNWQHTRLLRGHTDRVRSITFGPMGNVLVSGSDDQSVRVWDTEKDQCIRTLKGQSNWIYSIAFSPDGHMIASGGDDRCVHLWDVKSGKDIHKFAGHDYRIRSVAFSPDDKTIASASEDQTVRLWSVDGEHPPKVLAGHTDWVYCVTFSPDGEKVASSSEEQSIRLWDVKTAQCLKVLLGHTDWVRAVVFSPNGKVLASASEDQTVRLWDVEAGSCIKVLRDHTNRVWSVDFSSDGRMLVSGSDDQCVRVWSMEENWECLMILEGHKGRVWSVVYSPDNSCVASGSEDGTVRVWNAYSGECRQVLRGHTSKVCSVVYSPDGRHIASAGHDGTILIWDEDGKCVQTLRSDRLYERMNIKDVRGLTEAQKGMLKDLGATEL